MSTKSRCKHNNEIVKKSKDIKDEDLDAKLDLEYFNDGIASDPITKVGM